MRLERGVLWRSSSPLLHVLLLNLVVGVAYGQGKGIGVEVRSLSPVVMEAAPGRIISLSFRITSKTAGEEEFAETVQAPDGWAAVIPPANLRLAGGASVVRILAFAVPRTATAGQYDISYGVRSVRDYSLSDSAVTKVSVASISDLKLLPEAPRETVMAGDTVQIPVRVLNGGNGQATVNLKTSAPEGYKSSVTPAKVTLAPGASELLQVEVVTDAREQRSRMARIVLDAYYEGKAEPAVALGLPLDVVSLNTKPPDLYNRFPMVATVSLVRDRDEGTVLQAQLTGEGHLDEARTRFLSFGLLGPDVERSSFSRRSEYWLNYGDPRMDLALGDQSYEASYMTTGTRYGRGIGVAYHPPGDWAYSSYYNRNRPGEFRFREAAVTASHTFSNDGVLQVNFAKHDEGSGGVADVGEADLVSLEAEAVLGSEHHAEAEIAHSRGGSCSDEAYRFAANGSLWRGANYSLTKEHGGADYLGYFRDADYLTAGLSTPLLPKLNGNLSYSHWRQGLDPLSADDDATRETLAQFGLTYQISSDWYLQAELQRFHRRGVLQPLLLDERERVQRYSLGYSHGKYAVRGSVELGKVTDELAHTTEHPTDCSVNLSYLASDTLALSAYGSTSDDDDSDSRLLGGSNNLGLGILWRPNSCTTANLAYTRYGSSGGHSSDTDQLNLRLGHTLPDGRTVDLEVYEYSPFVGSDSETQYLLSYSVPFAMRLGKKTNVGGLQGRVFDVNTPAEAGVGKAIVVCSGGGGAVATRADGTFGFAGLPPGPYLLQIQRSSLGPARIPAATMPMLVQVEAGKTAEVTVGITGAGWVSGTVLLHKTRNGNGNGNGHTNGNGSGSSTRQDEGGTTIEGDPRRKDVSLTPEGMPGTIVELWQDRDILRTATDSKGSFRFDGLRPGHYRLKIYDNAVPEFYALDRTEVDVEVVAGAGVEVGINILPRTRRIKMVEMTTGRDGR